MPLRSRTRSKSHLKETEGQIKRLEQVFESLGEPVKSKTCDGMAGIIEEGKHLMGEDFDDATMDACLIAAAQKVEHYEIGSYGTVIAWAEAMGHDEAVRLLKMTLNEEEATDEKLSSLATGGINDTGRVHGARRRGRRGGSDGWRGPQVGARSRSHEFARTWPAVERPQPALTRIGIASARRCDQPGARPSTLRFRVWIDALERRFGRTGQHASIRLEPRPVARAVPRAFRRCSIRRRTPMCVQTGETIVTLPFVVA